MKSIVTGGAGFIGSHIVDKLVKLDHEVIVIDNESCDSHEHFYYNDKARYEKQDVQDYYGIEPLFKGVDYVFHLAAEVSIQSCIQNPVYSIDSNVTGTCSVLQASNYHGVKRVVFSSTSAIYGLANETPMNEDMEPDCLNTYSSSKLSGENLCKIFYKLYGLETCILRYFNVYGDRQPSMGQYAPVIGLFKQQIAEEMPITIVGDGLQTRDFVHVNDVAEANLKAAFSKNKKAIAQPINIGYGKNVSIMEIATTIGKDNLDFIHLSERLGEAQHTQSDNTRAKEILDWSPKISVQEWLQ